MDRQNIKEAARIANVSVSTISRALNNKPGLSEATRSRVLSICEELGYRPSMAARQLKVGKSGAIGLSLGIHDWQLSPYVTYMYEILSEKLHQQGLMPNLYRYDDMEKLVSETSVAVLFGVEENDPRIEELEQKGVPYVCIGKRYQGFWVCPDDELGGFLAADHLIKQGCKNIGILEVELEDKGTRMRYAGFQRACADANMTFTRLLTPEAQVIELSTYRYCYQNMQQQLHELDGLFCETDQMAYGIAGLCADLDIKIPTDLRLVGFDDMPVYSNDLTTIRQNLSDIALAVIKLIGEAKNGQSPRGILIPVSLVHRKSS